ncbi:MAG: glutamine-hydrolyzing GMP synthase, partial [Aquificaceae bacterium]|nr:glutamine-hydrolyzing GMP synthase [Aquificaceae bacterium]
MVKRSVLVLNFGSQYVQLIARRVRELGVYSEIVPYHIGTEEIKRRNPYCLILSGGPASVYEEGAPLPDPGIYGLGIPLLGICYGLQVMVHQLGGVVERAEKQEYGRSKLKVLKENHIFEGLPKEFDVWMSHGDKAVRLPEAFESLASSENSAFAVIRHIHKPLYGVQFHPEVVHTIHGKELLGNFLFRVSLAEKNWSMGDFLKEKREEIRKEVGEGKVICALSGGVDSTVSAVLTHRAVGDRLHCIFVNHGLLRKGEVEEVEGYFRQLGLPFQRVDAEELFLQRLEGVEDPEEKRRVIGHTFVEVFEREAGKLGADFLLQGTLYPDVVESAGIP